MDDIAGAAGAVARARELGRIHRHHEVVDVLEPLVECLEPEGPEAAEVLVVGLCTLAVALVETTEDLGRCHELLDRADDARGRHGLDALRLQVEQARGFCLMRSGDVEGALRAYDLPDEVLGAADAEDRCRLLLNRGVLRLQVGSLAAAHDDLAAASGLAHGLGHAELAFKARHNLGYVDHLRGDLPAALRRMGQPVSLPDPHGVAAALADDPLVVLDRVRALIEAGLFDEANEAIDPAIRQLHDQRRWSDEGEARIVHARLRLLVGDNEGARIQAADALEAFTRQGNSWWSRHARLVMLAARVEELQQASGGAQSDGLVPGPVTAELAAQLASVLDEAREQDDLPAVTMAQLMAAEVALQDHRLDDAAGIIAAAEPHPADGISTWLRWRRAEAELASHVRPHRVHDLVRDGLERLAVHQARLGSLDIRTAVAVHGHELAQLGVEAAMDHADSRTLHAALERAKAASSRVAPVQTAGTRDADGSLGDLRRTLADLDRLQSEADPDPAAVAAARERAARLVQQVRSQEWMLDGADAALDDLVSLQEVHERTTRAGATAVSWFVRAARLWTQVLRPDGRLTTSRGPGLQVVVELVATLRADLDALLMAGLPGSLRRVVSTSLDSSLASLDRLLLEPLSLDDEALVVSPTAELAVLPWALLPSCRGRPTTVSPSLSSWVRRMDREPRAGGVVSAGGPGLARAADEVVAVAGLWPSAVGAPNASAAVVRDALGRADIVHLAAHGTHQPSSPLFSSLLLADGPLFAYEVDVARPADLVVLSACQLGSANIRPGDEPLGFSAALLHAGVGTVVAGLTAVRDDVAHDVMIDLHGGLVAGQPPAAALAAAMRSAWEAGEPAPFTCVGAGLRPVAMS